MSLALAFDPDIGEKEGPRVSIWLNFISGSVWRIANIDVKAKLQFDRTVKRHLEKYPNAKPVPPKAVKDESALDVGPDVEIKSVPESDEDKTFIQIETRILYVDDNSLHDTGLYSESKKDPDIWLPKAVLELKTEAAFFSGAADDRTKVNLPVEGALLDDMYVDMFIEATRKSKEASLLTSPRIVVADGEEAILTISQATPFIVGYKEDPSATPGEPLAIHDEINTGVELNVTPHITEDGKHIVLDLESSLSEITGHEQRQYKKYRYDVPQLEELEMKCSDMYVPEGKTLLIFSPRPKGASDKNPRNVLLLITPQIAEPDSKPPTLPHGGSLGGGMGGGFGGGFGSADE